MGGLPDSDTNMSLENFIELVQQLLPALKIMTISPSLESKIHYDRFKYLLENNIVPSLGHDTVATEDDILGALRIAHIQSKPVHITHLFNVSKIHHRDVSLVNFGLLSEYPNIDKYNSIVEPTVEIIGDLVHVHPLAIQLALQSKNRDKIAFITDAIMDGGQEGKTVTYCGRLLKNVNGQVLIQNTNTLAGSCTNLYQIFRNLIQILKVDIFSAVQMLSENPARIAGLNHIGKIQIGKRADLLLFSEDFDLKQVLIGGELAFNSTT